MKILYVTDTREYGGGERYLESLITSFSDGYAETELLIPSHENTAFWQASLKRKGIPTNNLNLYRSNKVKVLIDTFLYIKQSKPDIIHFNLNDPLQCKYPVLSAGLAGIPSFCTIHSISPDFVPQGLHKFTTKFTIRLFSQIFRRIIVVSQYSKNLILNIWNFPEDKVKVIYNGIDPKIFSFSQKKREKFRNTLKLKDLFTFGFAGRFDNLKRVDFLISSFAKATKQNDQMSLVIAGTGRKVVKLKNMIIKLKIAERVHFLNFVEDLSSFYSGIDAFVLPSKHEACPFALLEAMAVQRPPIVSSYPGIKEIVKDEENGFLIEPMKIDDFTAKLLEVSRREGLDNIGKKTRETVVKKYSLNNMITKTREVYEEILRQ